MTGIPVWWGAWGLAFAALAAVPLHAEGREPGPPRVHVHQGVSRGAPASGTVWKRGTEAAEAAAQVLANRRQFPHHLFSEGAPTPEIQALLSTAEHSSSPTLEPGVVKLAVIRVDFLQDSAADSSSGNGKFDLRTGTGIPVDPPPRNRAYFEAHMEALKRFYNAQSYDTVEIQATVFPPGDTTAYHLEDTKLYGPWSIGQSQAIINRAEAFVTDAILAADASGDIDFSRFDEVMIFHAGPDFQGDIYGDTPYDIPSYTLTYGVPLQTSTGEISRANVLPETTTQDEYLGALNGVVAHEMGHLFGLPDLYNIFNGAPQVGWFSLMDSGENISVILVDEEYGEFEVRGVFPTSLDPWSKLQAFPEVMERIFVGESYATALEAVQNKPLIPVVSIDPAEYFLIENRALDLDGNDSTLVKADSLTGVLLGPVDSDGNFDPFGSREYDAVLPGGGVAIWHVDETLVLPALADRGQINRGLGARGVALEEADGVWDIGFLTRFPWGQPNDLYFGENNAEFGPATVPSSESNRGAYTGIEISITGDVPAIFMGVEVKRTTAMEGWPRVLQQGASAYRSTSTDLNDDGYAEFLVGFSQGDLNGALAFNSDGSLYPSASEVFLSHTDNLTGAWSVSEQFVFPSEPPQKAFAVADVEGKIVVWDSDGGTGSVVPSAPKALTSPVLVQGNGLGRVIYGGVSSLVIALPSGTETVTIPGGSEDVAPTTEPAVMQRDGEPRSAALGFGRSVDVFDLNTQELAGSRVFSRLVTLVTAGPVFYKQDVFGVVAGDSLFLLDAEARQLAAWPAQDVVAMITSDLDEDGSAEIIAGSVSGQVDVFNSDGTSAVGWPFQAGGRIEDLKTADLDGDGHLDLAVLDEHGVLYGLTGAAQSVAQFPRSVGPLTHRETHLAPMTSQGLVWVSVSEQGVLSTQRLEAAGPMEGDWRHPRGGVDGSLALDLEEPRSPKNPALGSTQFIAFPNPVHGDQVSLRFVLEEGEVAHLNIVDVRGASIPARLTSPAANAPGENTQVWHLQGVAPGLYYCKLDRVGSQGTRTDLVPVAVIR